LTDYFEAFDALKNEVQQFCGLGSEEPFFRSRCRSPHPVWVSDSGGGWMAGHFFGELERSFEIAVQHLTDYVDSPSILRSKRGVADVTIQAF
jgi:hypothetical protein